MYIAIWVCNMTCIHRVIGYYCPAGTIDPWNATIWELSSSYPMDPSSLLCPSGHYCPEGSAQPQVCAAGTYQSQSGQASCEVCPSGSWCGEGTVHPSSCPLGSYCLEGTRYPTEYVCPNGTYGGKMNLTSASECSRCSPGSYCSSAGLTAPTGLCKAGMCSKGLSFPDRSRK
jgi:hypothetical protein